MMRAFAVNKQLTGNWDGSDWKSRDETAVKSKTKVKFNDGKQAEGNTISYFVIPACIKLKRRFSYISRLHRQRFF